MHHHSHRTTNITILSNKSCVKEETKMMDEKSIFVLNYFTLSQAEKSGVFHAPCLRVCRVIIIIATTLLCMFLSANAYSISLLNTSQVNSNQNGEEESTHLHHRKILKILFFESQQNGSHTHTHEYSWTLVMHYYMTCKKQMKMNSK